MRLAATLLMLIVVPNAAVGEPLGLGLGPKAKSACRRCESSARLRSAAPFSIPTHAIVIDRGNGVLSRESYAVVVDLDARETSRYHFHHEQDGNLTLVDKAVKSVPPEIVPGLIHKANILWNPPIPKKMPAPIMDLFETTYVDLKDAVEASGQATATPSSNLEQASAAGSAVPADMQGVWAKHGRCDVRAERITITAHSAGWGKGPFAAVNYDPEFTALFWDEEGVVDNFVFGRSHSVLIHNTQGFHMPGEVGLARCSPKMNRVPWPPR
jgi:hypothetical protein